MTCRLLAKGRGSRQELSLWSCKRQAMAQRIEDYALIGDCKTAALVGRDGSIDWLCWPRFDSRVLCRPARDGDTAGGSLLQSSRLSRRRRYRPGTLILETEFQTETGCAAVIDFMPPADGADLVRIVIGRSGRVDFRTELVVRFNYGATVPWVNRLDDGAINAIAGPERMVLRTPAALHGEDLKTLGELRSRPASPFPSSSPTDPHFRVRRRRSILSDAGAHGSVLAPVERSVSRRRPMDRSGQTFAHHVEGFDLRAERRDRRRCHDVAARAAGRREELGLPLLLAARRHIHAPGLHASRLLR